MSTYNDIYLETRKALRTAGIASFDLEARLIVEHASGMKREEYLRVSRKYPPNNRFEKTVLLDIARRLAGEPIAYIVGQWEFYSMPMRVTADTLIPRVDTEVLAERAITILRGGVPRLPDVLDLCCGTGCVGLAIAHNVPAARVTLADVSEAAVKVAKENAELNTLTKRVRVTTADATEPPPPLFGPFHMIVCNPPYIPTREIELLDRSVRGFEPHSALDGGEDGLDFFRAIASNWKNALTDSGTMLFEIGVSQSDAVCAIMRDNGFREISVTRDLEGIERVVEGRSGG